MANLVCLALYLCANLLEDELSGNGHPAHASPGLLPNLRPTT